MHERARHARLGGIDWFPLSSFKIVDSDFHQARFFLHPYSYLDSRWAC